MTVQLSKDEASLEAYLTEKGLRKDAMSKVVEEAIEKFFLRQPLRESHGRNAQLDPEEVKGVAEDAVRDYRGDLLSRQMRAVVDTGVLISALISD